MCYPFCLIWECLYFALLLKVSFDGYKILSRGFFFSSKLWIWNSTVFWIPPFLMRCQLLILCGSILIDKPCFLWFQSFNHNMLSLFSLNFFLETSCLESLILPLHSELSPFKPVVHIVNSFTDLVLQTHCFLRHIPFFYFLYSLLYKSSSLSTFLWNSVWKVKCLNP